MKRLLPLMILLYLLSMQGLAQNQVVNNGDATVPIILQGTGCNYNWTVDQSIGLVPLGSGNIPSFTAVNTGTQPITAHITAKPITPLFNAYMANQFAGNVATVGTEDRGIPGTPAVGTGLRSYGIAVTLDGTGMLVTNQTAKTVAVFRQFLTFRLISTLSVGDSPKGIAISPDGSTAYVVNSTDGVVWMIDVANAALSGTFTVSSTLQDATGITVSPDGNLLYITYNQSGIMAVVDAHAHTLIKQVVVGSGPAGVAISDDGKYVYVANQNSNSVSIINTTTNYSVTSVTVGSKPFGIVATHNGSRVYVTNQGDNTVSCITTSSNSVSTIPVGHGPIGISVSPDDQFVLVANHDEPDNNVSVIHTADNSVTYVSTYRGQGNFSFGNFIPGGVGCSPVPVTFDITVNPTPPSITASGPLAALTTSYKVPSASTSFTVSGLSLTGPIFVGPPPGFEVSTDNINFNSSGVNLGTSGNITGTVYVRLAATTQPGTYSGNINLSSGSVTASIATAPSTVNPAQPYVSAGPVSGKVTSCLGSPSTSTLQFTLTAVELNAALTATTSGPFEVSLRPDYGFSNSIEVANIIGDLGPTVIYVRIAASPTAGRFRGSVALRTNGAASRNVDVSGLVYPAPVANPVANQQLVNGNNTQAVHFTGTGSNTFTWTNDHPEIGLAPNGTGDISSFKAVNTRTTQIKATVTAYPVSTGLIYVSNIGLNPNTGTSTVAVINPTDNTLIASIPVGSSPKTMIINEDATRIYVANTGTSDVSVIDLGTNQKIATIPVGLNPLGMSFNDDGTQLSVYNTDDFSISVIDVATNTLISTHHATDRYPPGSIKSIDGKRIYVYNFAPGPSYFVYDATTNDFITSLGLGASPGGLALSPDGTKVYLANGPEDRVEVYDANTYALITTMDVGDQPKGISLTRDGKQLYVANQGDNTVSIINTDLFDVTTLRSDNNSFALPTNAISTGGTGCSGLPAVFTITVDPSPPTIIAAGTPDPMFTTAGVASPSSSFLLSATNLIQGITIEPPAGFEVSVDNLHFFPFLIVGAAGNMPAATIYVRLTATAAVGNYSGNIRLSSSPATDVFVPVTGTVAAAVPTVTGSAATGSIMACVGNASLSPNIQQFTVSGFLLTTDAVATAPATGYFELSLNVTGPYANQVSISPVNQKINGTVVYVRSSITAPAGPVSGNVQLSGGSIVRTVAVSGIIHPPPVVNTVPDKTVTDGTPVTVNFSGTGNNYSWENSNPDVGLAATSGFGNIAFNATNHGISPITADIKVRPHSASLAYIPASGFVYVEDLATNTQVERIKVGSVPYAVAASPDGLLVYVANQASNSISVINTGSNTVIATILAGNGTSPSGLAVSPDGLWLYVANRSTNNISVINAINNTILPFRIPVDNGPEGIAVGPEGRVYVVNQNRGSVSIIEPGANHVASSFNTGRTPEGIAISPDGSSVYVTNYNDASVTVFNTHTNTVSTIRVGTSPAGIAISQDGSRVYVANSGSNTVSVINTADNTVLTTIGGLRGTSPKGISVSPDGQTIYTADYSSNNVSVIDMHGGNTVISTIDNVPAPVSFGNFITTGSGCDGMPMTFHITVQPSATHISVTGAPSALTTTYGTPSASTSFNVAGINMSGGIVVTPPAGFEVSADGTHFSHTVTIGSAGTIVTSPVYIRLAVGTSTGSYDGNITLASSGQNTLNVPMPQSAVNPAPLTITADNKSRLVGLANPILTASYAGFVNAEGPAQLTTQPTLSTIADINSPAGQYPITVMGAASPNYDMVYVPGTLTVSEAPAKLIVANAFTPNGDGINDTWVINDMDTYPGCTVAVFNRNGQRVFFSVNYPMPWNGRYNGSDLPAGTYYYIITLGNGFKPIAGYVAIIR